MFGYAVVACLAVVLFWLDPILQALAPSTAGLQQAPVLRRTPRPAINDALLALEDAESHDAAPYPEDASAVHIFSKAPLVLYVENFLSVSERRHLVEIRYSPSHPLFFQCFA